MGVSKRARNQQQKSERRRDILAATRELFPAQSFAEISMDAIAKKAGMAKGTVFLYFKTKEELFLALTSQEFTAMFADMDERLSFLAQDRIRPSQGQLLTLLQEVLAGRRLLVHLIAIQHIILERNVGYAEARDFKLTHTRGVLAIGAKLERLFPFLKPGQGARFILYMYALVIGIAHVAVPAPVIRDVYRREPETAALRLDFETEYFAALNAIWEGWQAQARRRKELA